jgi:PAS domain S-box-containing protein/diguanylate cyclase (GGDEF)-like protein
MLTDLDGNVEEMNSLARSMIERVYGGNFSGAIYSFLPNTEDFMSFKRQVAQQKGHISLEAKDNEIETVDYDIRLEPFMVSGQKKYIVTFVDISDRIKVFNELKQSHAQISAFNALLNDHASVSETDLAGNITHVNDKCCSLTGYSRSELIGQNHRMLSSGDHPPEFWQMVWEIILRGEVWHGEITNKNKHGERYWIYATIMPFKDSQGEIYKFVSARTDITKIKKAEQALHELAYQDPLTGQPNLAYFKERVDEEIHRLQTFQHNSKLVTADININHLMEINSTFGWDYGDKLISAISSSLDASKIQAEVIAKVSGERFALLLLCNEDIEEYIVRLETEIAAVFSEPFVIEDKPIKVSYASGIVVSPDDLDELGAFAQTASNINNYLELCKAEAAKRHGNNCIRFSNELLAHVSKRTLILHEITTAIENDELYMVYQPQLSLKNDRVVGVEALMRWQKDDGSYVSPGDFIPVLEVSDFIRALTVWSSRQCFEDLKKIQKSFPDCRMGINISANFLTDQAFEQSLEQAIHEFEIKPHSIEIEVTESAIMDDMEVALSQLSRAREKGFRVSIDDFGTGHSSLSYLVQFPVDQLKIDKSFIRQLEHSKQSLSVVNTIITLGKELGLDVIAEGTETRQQIEILRECDCDEVQGFYYAKPMKLNDLFTWFKEFKITGKQ